MVVEDGGRVGRCGRVLGGDDDDVPVVDRHAQRRGGRRRDRRVVAAPVEQGLEEGDAAGVLPALHLQLGQPVRLRHHQRVAVDGLPHGTRHVELGVPVARDRPHGLRCPARRPQMLGHHLPHHPAPAPVGLEHGVQRYVLLRAPSPRLARRVLAVALAGRQPAEVLQGTQQVVAADLPQVVPADGRAGGVRTAVRVDVVDDPPGQLVDPRQKGDGQGTAQLAVAGSVGTRGFGARGSGSRVLRHDRRLTPTRVMRMPCHGPLRVAAAQVAIAHGGQLHIVRNRGHGRF